MLCRINCFTYFLHISADRGVFVNNRCLLRPELDHLVLSVVLSAVVLLVRVTGILERASAEKTAHHLKLRRSAFTLFSPLGVVFDFLFTNCCFKVICSRSNGSDSLFLVFS